MQRRAYIAFGSNLGDRRAAFSAAGERLGKAGGIVVLRASSAIETAPLGGPAGQGKYLNAVFEVDTTLSPAELLAALHAIERDLGRDRPNELRWAARTCDLDILLMGEVVLDTPELTIPHPRMHQRHFVLAPLAQIAPQARHPLLGKTAVQMLAALEEAQKAQKAEGGQK